jgi:glycosyltransferase involved in cell wall biosynthesis
MTTPALSVVIPVFDEGESVEPLVERVVEAVRPLGRRFELVVVDDGSRDDTLARLRRLVASVPELVVVALRRNFGQTLALQAGFDCARGDVIVTLDGDLQNDPRDIPALLAEIERGADVVSGWRRDRHDALVLRKIPSWIANRLIRRITGVTIHDQGCSLKAYRRDVIRGLDLYSDMHRFVAVLTMAIGASISEVVVRHHPRTAGRSKYGLTRVFKVIADLLTIQMLTWFREHPLRWFVGVGLPAFALGLVASTAAFVAREHTVVWTSVAFVALTTFASCLLCGLLGELVIESARPARGRRIVLAELTAR